MATAYLISIGLLWLVDPDGRVKSYFYSLSGAEWIKDVLVILLILAVIIILAKVKEKYFDK